MGRSPWIAGAGLVVSAALAAQAAADVGVQVITRTAHRGETARLRVFALPRMPLYLVTASRAPRPFRCRENAICEPQSIGPPNRWPYVRLRPRSRSPSLVVRVRVPPTLRPGLYRAVLYCEPCVRARAGSLIVSDGTLAVRR